MSSVVREREIYLSHFWNKSGVEMCVIDVLEIGSFAYQSVTWMREKKEEVVSQLFSPQMKLYADTVM